MIAEKSWSFFQPEVYNPKYKDLKLQMEVY